MEKWSCIWDDLANPKIGLNLVPNPLVVPERCRLAMRKMSLKRKYKK